MREILKDIIHRAALTVAPPGELDDLKLADVLIEHPKEKGHGDFATNLALILAKRLKKSPRKLADEMVEALKGEHHFISRVETAGPGFINFFLSDDWYRECLREIKKKGPSFGRVELGGGKSVQIEFVSANPVGPMHVGHGRWAAVGDALARLLNFAGYRVHKEFYINDYGNQMNIFAASVTARYLELFGRQAEFPPEGYMGEYVKDIAADIIELDGDRYVEMDEAERLTEMGEAAYKDVITHTKRVLSDMGVTFDNWFSERELHRSGAVLEAVWDLKRAGFTYEENGAVWFASTKFSDDKDRVLIRESGEPTYFAADVAYHKDKLKRGFDGLIDIWGADHHGYAGRVKAAIEALGYPKDKLTIIIGQLVNLLRAGEPVRMSKRTGEMVTLEELLSEVGSDAARYFFLTKSTDTALDFDIELAKKRSSDNPVYYVQYAHARISSIIRFADEKGVKAAIARGDGLSHLDHPSELDLMRKLAEFEEVIEISATKLAPYRLTKYAEEVAGLFHVFYTKCRVIFDEETASEEDLAKSGPRLILAEATRQIIANCLSILGISAPDKM
ncbi:MAG: arginine--tRNA ligase [Actinomycetota bacterium]|nr:arginine--tRNA ligase [Actinomycetota bacterium]